MEAINPDENARSLPCRVNLWTKLPWHAAC